MTSKAQALVAFTTAVEERSLEHVAMALNLASTLQFLRRVPTFIRERLCEVRRRGGLGRTRCNSTARSLD